MKRKTIRPLDDTVLGQLHDAMSALSEFNREFAVQQGRPRTYRVDVYGCQMNERDAETMAGLLEESGCHPAAEGGPADIILFVTCCVRENAEEKIFGHIGALSHECRENNAIILAGGCMMQQPHIVDRIRKSFPQVKVVFGTHNLHMLPVLLMQWHERRKRVFDVRGEADGMAENLPVRRGETHKAWVSIMYGCNNFCAYCIVPHVRGRERSRAMADILAEIRTLGETGCREITLLGQNVNSYGNDLGETNAFTRLLEEIERVPGIERVRFMTSHPKDLSDDLIAAMGSLDKLCPHLHLPVQSGSDAVLARMNRKYDRARYLHLVERVRAACPGISLTTDIIVGFPGETEADFEQTLDLVRRVGFDAAFMFLYSPRKGTPAVDFDDPVPDGVAGERFRRLLALQTEIATERARPLVDSVQQVLVDGRSRENDAMYAGRTAGNRLVNFTANRDATGTVVPVRIVRAGAFWLEGCMEVES